MTTRLIIEFIRRELGNEGVAQLLELARTGYTEQDLLDEHRWFSYELKHDLYNAAARLMDDPHFTRRMGEGVLEFNIGTSFILALKAFGSPKRVYQNVTRAAAKFQTTHGFEVMHLHRNSARIRCRGLRGFPTRQADCDYITGLLSTVPCLFGAPPAKIRHRSCAVKGDECCEYDISWERSGTVLRDSIAIGVGAAVALTVPATLAGLPVLAMVATAVVPVVAGVFRGIMWRNRRQRQMLEENRERLTAYEDELVQLTASLRELGSELKIEDVLESITRHASAAVGGKRYALALDIGGGQLSLSHTSDLRSHMTAVLESWVNDLDEWPRGHLVVEDTSLDPQLAPLAQDGEMPVRALCAAPLEFKGERLGVILVLSDQVQGFLPRDFDLLASYAAQAAAAITNARLYAQAEERASRDPLTSLLNHRQFHEKLADEIERSQRYASRVALVLMDLDGFKAINDVHGHREGDRVLRDVGEAIASSSRAVDVAFRVGGDEFALILPEVGAEAARNVAERTQAAIAKKDGRIAVSCGIAAWPEDADDKEALIMAADMALYRAKERVHSKETAGKHDMERLPVSGHVEAAGPIERLKVVKEHLSKQHRQLVLANAVGTDINQLLDQKEIYKTAVRELRQTFNYRLVALMKLSEDGSELVTVCSAGPATKNGSATLDTSRRPVSAEIASRVVRGGESLIVDDVTAEPESISGGDNGGIRSELCVPVRDDDEVWGVLYIAEPGVAAFDSDDVALARTLAEKIATAIHCACLYEEIEDAYIATVEALTGALEAMDSYVASHAREIADKAVRVGHRLGLTDSELRSLRYGALLHDIGKIAISTEILNKSGPLTLKERDRIAEHTVIGAQILAPVPFLADVLPIVRHAHERWDGKGYPDNLEGEEIPIMARIVFVCDAFHAMTSARPYRDAMSREQAYAELSKCAGSQFDPAVVDAFMEVEGRGSLRATEATAG